ncbi:hypothetical protein [Clostridium sp. 1001283B150210_160208_E6]|uniref:hypothetical protein n=1 Tax=Clostridium sp. 1001283B150210_160208_E6 TaxID=2787129 RepID=UPI0018AB113E|nr:hypothetical protein [Clostridium sp. 1001283B150210_160208_E6]
MKRLVVNEDYVLTELYRFGDDDNFDYWYWRNNNIFDKNNFYKKLSEYGYADEKYPDIENILIEAKILNGKYIVIPKSNYSLIENNNDDTWDVLINGVNINIINLFRKSRFGYNDSILNIMRII